MPPLYKLLFNFLGFAMKKIFTLGIALATFLISSAFAYDDGEVSSGTASKSAPPVHTITAVGEVTGVGQISFTYYKATNSISAEYSDGSTFIAGELSDNFDHTWSGADGSTIYVQLRLDKSGKNELPVYIFTVVAHDNKGLRTTFTELAGAVHFYEPPSPAYYRVDDCQPNGRQFRGCIFDCMPR